MKNIEPTVAKKFLVYKNLSLLDQWIFHHSLKWIRNDPSSLELVLTFEKQLLQKSIFWRQIYKHIKYALRWYNREYRGVKPKDPLQVTLPRGRLSELLQLVLIFISRNQKLSYRYRELFLNILSFSDTIGRDPRGNAVVTPERFRLEIAEIFCDMNDRWQVWNGWYPSRKNYADQILGHFAHIANRVNNLQVFSLFRIEIQKPYFYKRMDVGKLFACLESITNKVDDLPSCQTVFQDIVPVIGLELTSSLMDLSQDFHEFKAFFHRFVPQLEYWGRDAFSLLTLLQNGAELDRFLIFLVTLDNHPLMHKCTLYNNCKYPPGGTLQLKPVTKVKEVLSNGYWKEGSPIDRVMDDLIGAYIQNIMNLNINVVWGIASSRKILWEFNTFTDYIPYEKRALDWSQDTEETRRYWNWQLGMSSELDRFRETLLPRLVSVFIELNTSDFETLIKLLPGYIFTQEITKIVDIPVKWELQIHYEERYAKHIGFYDEKVEVARPIDYMKHEFKFQRLDLQPALDILNNPFKTRDTIRAEKQSRP